MSQRASDFAVGLSLWGESNVPIDIASNIAFPNIFAFSAMNATTMLSTQIVAKSRVMMTLQFNAPYCGQPITSLTVSGLLFAPSVLQQQPTAQCDVNFANSPTRSTTADSAIFDVISAQLRIAFISGQNGQPAGLHTGSASSLLAITCKISNLVNVQTSAVERSTVSLVAFGSNDAPLYIQTAIKFPAIFVQSLGLNRPRVRFFLQSNLDRLIL